MGGALIQGALDIISQHDCWFYSKNKKSAQLMANMAKGHFAENKEDLSSCDIYFLGCKPQQIKEVATEFYPLMNNRPIIVSFLAGVSLNTLRKLFPNTLIVRSMPNLGSKIGEGVTSILWDKEISRESKNTIQKFFESSSLAIDVQSEKEIDQFTVFTGALPGLFFEFSRIVLEQAISMGIDESLAKKAIFKTLKGSSLLLSESGELPGVLRDSVASKGGVTESGLNYLNDHNFNNILTMALTASYKKAIEISQKDLQ